ncbi:unnamed protein product [Penicillium salamii]|nr:unnamed protein product [Penicillium salamii]CAG8284213.1 unnamed protein product [Penicillium salamii]
MAVFTAPKLSLGTKGDDSIRTLPDLIDFHGKHNPQDLFCLQGTKELDFVPVSYKRLQCAIVRCQDVLRRENPGLHPPKLDAEGRVKKCSPVALLMESHVGLAIYVLACMGMGVPVMLLSARLSSSAVCHLLQEAHASFVVASPRLQTLVPRDTKQSSDTDGVDSGKDAMVRVCVASEWESLLVEESAEQENQPLFAAQETHFVSRSDRQVIILHSSGTSGLPKPIPCSHEYFLGYATCHTFASGIQAALTFSTLPLFHGFGFVAICLSLGVGKTVCIPPPSTVPNGTLVIELLRTSGASALLTVPSILEELESLSNKEGLEALAKLDFVGFGGGMPKELVGSRLEAAGVRLVAQYGATETGPMSPFFIPDNGHNWRRLRLRHDILEPLEVKLHPYNTGPDLPNDQLFSYKLSMRPFGWDQRFELQDLIVATTEYSQGSDMSKLEWFVAGRTDDLICLATGEKVRPTILESLLKQHHKVRHAVAFGDNQFELGVIIEPAETMNIEEVEKFKTEIWPVIEEASMLMDAHAKITSPAAMLIVPPCNLPRSDKGTVSRKAVATQYAAEIAAVYRNLEVITAPALDLSSPDSRIHTIVAEITGWKANSQDDLFTLGMDSLQATKLRRLLKGSVQATHLKFGSSAKHIIPSADMSEDFVYRHPSISQISDALYPSNSATDNHVSVTHLFEQFVDKYTDRHGQPKGFNVATSHRIAESYWVALSSRLFLLFVTYFCSSIIPKYPLIISSQRQYRGAVVVLTGTTGSLGSFLLAQLLPNDSINRVICLNRPGKDSAVQTQKAALHARKISVADDHWSKVDARQTDTSAEWLGLGKDGYYDLVSEVTHIVHVAWPMNFKMGIQSYEGSFKTLQSMLTLARICSSRSDIRKCRLLFISSISTVGNYSIASGDKLVPEVIPNDPNATLNLGYARAKLVCEKMVQHAASEYPDIEAGVVRVGQISGAVNGYWNANEHFVAMCASSQKVGKFPDLHGVSSRGIVPRTMRVNVLTCVVQTFSWLPVDSAARAVSEIIFQDKKLELVYHLENPVRQSWRHVAALLSRELEIPNSSVIPLDQWLAHISSVSGPENPAASLVDFLKEDFLKMSCGSVILDTSASRNASQTIACMGPVGDDSIQAYVRYWKSINLLR